MARSKDKRISHPEFEVGAVRRYRLRPRKKRSFNTILEAKNILDPSGERPSTVTYEPTGAGEGRGIRLQLDHPLALGVIRETLSIVVREDRLVSERLVRLVHDHGSDDESRREEIDFAKDALGLPSGLYPEVTLPYLLGWQPFDGKIRDVFAWINDRFVARVEYQTRGTERIVIGGEKVEAVKMIMYPDLNDWVKMPRVLTRLARPFVPKYHMWYETKPPYALLRFEGPYGPPGAPEIELELLPGGKT